MKEGRNFEDPSDFVLLTTKCYNLFTLYKYGSFPSRCPEEHRIEVDALAHSLLIIPNNTNCNTSREKTTETSE